MFMIGSKILRFVMSLFYEQVAKALVSSFDSSTSQEKMAVVIIPVVIATWESSLLHALETQHETRV